jgi:hypothetical protein
MDILPCNSVVIGMEDEMHGGEKRGEFCRRRREPASFFDAAQCSLATWECSPQNYNLLQYMPAFPGKFPSDNGDVCGTHLDTSTKLPPSLACVALKWVFTKLA